LTLESFYQKSKRTCRVCFLPLEIQEEIEDTWDSIGHSAAAVVGWLASTHSITDVPKYQVTQHCTTNHKARRG